MTLVVVEDVVSQRDFGVIFSARVADMSDERHGERLRVRATRVAMIGEPAKGETWRIEGERRSTRWGLQIEATHATRTMPTGKLIRDFLANHVAGIGHDRATRLWLAYETDLPRILDEGDVDAIADVIAPDRPVLAPRLAAACVSAWREAAGETRLVEWLGAIGVDDVRTARRLFAILGDHAVERLAANPWSLVALMPWPKVDALGTKLLREANAALVETAPQRLVGAVDASIKDLIGTGATVIADGDLRVRVGAALRTSATNPVVSEAVDLGDACGALVRYGDRWRAPGCALMEQAIEERLSSMASVGGHPFPTESDMHHAIRDFERRHGSLHAEQRAAVLKVMFGSLACIQGGAGVGKTYATKAVCDLWEQAGGTVLLAALAGKAALRLSRATGRLARTLFRTLKEIDEREARGQGAASPSDDGAVPRSAPLAEITSNTLVIVDEASMVDLGTMYGLLRRMPAGARLLLIGDHRQLPPVGFGLVFHKLIHDDGITARLTFVHRQSDASGIPAVAASLRERTLPRLPPFELLEDGASFIQARGAEEIAASVVDVACRMGVLDGADVVVVTPTNGGAAGTGALNARLHDLRRERDRSIEMRGALGERFSDGDPILFRRNDYRRGLFNGSLGTVVATVPAERSLLVRFEDTEHLLDASDLVDVSVGYALTCHRAQGSQAATVIVAIPRSRVIDPSWIYTAVTRAERKVILIGDDEALRASLAMPWTSDTREVGFLWPPSRGEIAGDGRAEEPYADLS